MIESSALVIDDEYPLSPLQHGMLFRSLDRSEPGAGLYQVLSTLTEKLDVTQLLAAWETVVARYDVLRTSFNWEGRAEPVQHVHRSVKLPARVLDWRHLTADEQRERLAGLIADDRATDLTLSQAPLMRLTIAVCGTLHFEVLWTFHHAILDARSFPILLREVFGAYDAGRTGRDSNLPAPRQYRSYIDWLATRNPEASQVFWRRRLAGFSTPTPLLVSVPPGRGEGVGNVELALTPDETRRLHAFAREAQCTVGTLVAGSWALLLNRYTGKDDVLFGVTRACGQSTIEGADDMVGPLISALPFRISVPPETTVFAWLAALRSEQLAFREHEHTPLARVQSWSDVPRGTALFETLVVFENHRLDSLLRREGGAWINRRFAYQGQTNYPITLVYYDDAELFLRLEYDRQALDGAMAALMLQHVRRLLEGLAKDGHRQLAEVSMLGGVERTELLPVPRPSGIQTFCLHERFERRAAETPDAPALTFDGRTLTYEALNRRANQLAHRLRSLGVSPDVLVGVHLERSPDLVIAILGILKAGGAYVPLDPAYPHDRLRFMLEDAHVSLIVTARPLTEGLPASGAEIICVEDIDGEPEDNPQHVAEPDNLAYVIYTSESTAKPKGVLITHANVSRLFDASEISFQFGRDDVWTLFHSYGFDFSVWEIWGALLYGGRLVVVPDWVSRDPDALIDLLVRERVTVLNQTPSAFRQLIQAEGERPAHAPFAVRFIVLGGEALDVSSLRPWFERHGDERPHVINMFGITETTIHVTYRRLMRADVEAGAGSVIGVPIADLDVYVLDRYQELVPVGVTGEIYVGGAGLARGYLDRAELTRARFVADPVGGTERRLYRSGDLGRWLPSGELEYRGRVDDHVTQPAIGRTPSDFALADLDQSALDQLIGRFARLTDVYPLTPMQQLFFSMDGVDASPGFGQWEFLLEGELDADRLREAWRQMAARHSILRTAFAHVGAAKPHQVVLDHVDVPWHVEDWRESTPEQQDDRRREFLAADQLRPFDLAVPPLMRIALVRTGEMTHRLIWTTHHLLVDGWSWPRIVSDVSALYTSGTAASLEPACAYRAYVEWMQLHDGAFGDAFWRGVLSGVTDPTPMPGVMATRDNNREAAGKAVRLLTARHTAALGALARNHQVTLATIVGAAWSVVLAHHSGRSDVVFGASFAGRPDGIPGIESLVGPCVNNLPIRVRVDGRTTVGEWLGELHQMMGQVTEYQTTPLATIHACSGVPAWSRMFDSLLAVQSDTADTTRALGGLKLTPLRWPESTNYPATIIVRPGDELEIKVNGAGDRFGAASAATAADDLLSVLTTLADLRDGTVGGLLACLPAESQGRAGRAAAEQRRRRGPRLAARTETEKALTEIWRDLFDGEIGTDENYFELGAHSLMLLRAHERISSRLEPTLPITALFQYPTVRDLAAHLTGGSTPGRRDVAIRAGADNRQRAMERHRRAETNRADDHGGHERDTRFFS